MLQLKTLVPAVLCLLSLPAISQDFQKDFKELLVKRDTAGQRKLLTDWEAAHPNDPELFIACFNYYARKSKTEIVSINGDYKHGESFQLTDSTGKSVGFLGSTVSYNPAILQNGFDCIDKGIAMYPTRLDMRFGKVYMLGETENFAAFAETVVATVDYNFKVGHAWLWGNGEPLDNPQEFLLNAIQEYVTTIYNTGDDSLLIYMRQISEAVLKYHPDDVESLDNVALTYLIAGDPDKALPYLLRAESVAPQDVIVLNNIAEAYKRKNDKRNAKDYYNKIIKYGNKDEVARAKEDLKNL